MTAQALNQLIQSIGLLITAVAGCIAAWRGIANGAKLSQVHDQATDAKANAAVASDKVDTLTANVDGRLNEFIALVTQLAGQPQASAPTVTAVQTEGQHLLADKGEVKQ